VASGPLADEKPLRSASDLQHAAIDQRIVKDEVRLTETGDGAARQQSRIARSRAHQCHMPRSAQRFSS
jgi:hypothetical protein